jgi:acyl-CoA synthetase (AMP-forming)/AMP-acid ligase II/3-hydroxymyristoyl/3-hydroxydecanoyl-(acyl carrier protein) dehydratase
MPASPILLSHYLCANQSPNKPVAYHAGLTYSFKQFQFAVSYWVKQFISQPDQRYALFTEDAYPFAVLLFALLHAGKQVWLPGNNQSGTAQKLSADCQLIGDWPSQPAFDYCLQNNEITDQLIAPLNPEQIQMVIFTSGSTGQAKAITKTLNQLQVEVTALESYWGQQLGEAQVLATVSHQHIYGLLFRVLWPLYAGRCFHSHVYLNPELLIQAATQVPTCWVASPAHLKRLDADSPWQGIAQLKAIFSSGGVLADKSKQQITLASELSVLEIYGSSETGGIAWRQDDPAWQLFEGMSITEVGDGYWLRSPYLPVQSDGLRLDDQINLLTDGRFLLQGRSDRIVKIEEKRLSLIELEQRLLTSPLLEEVFALTSNKHRDKVAVVLVPSQSGKEMLANFGRKRLINQLKEVLTPWFERVVIPRKWLLANHMPVTAQGKIQQGLLSSLIDCDHQLLPQVLQITMTDHEVQLELKIPNTLTYFPDHFAGFPVLPGVVQLAWVAYFSPLFFGLDQDFKPLTQLESIKFSQIIKPNDELTLTLNWKAEQGKLQFKFSSAAGVYSSGRMVNS